MAEWNDAVSVCNEWHKKSCYDCPISEACIDRGGHKDCKEWKSNVIEATEKILKERDSE